MSREHSRHTLTFWEFNGGTDLRLRKGTYAVAEIDCYAISTGPRVISKGC